jgi:membrane protein DedA with SNARE-associated domain
MKEISSIAMDWLTYIGGVSVLWVFLVVLVWIQVATAWGVSDKNEVMFRLVPYAAGTAAGFLLLTGDANGALIGMGLGLVANLLRSTALFWLGREAAKPWLRKLAEHIKGNDLA